MHLYKLTSVPSASLQIEKRAVRISANKKRRELLNKLGSVPKVYHCCRDPRNRRAFVATPGTGEPPALLAASIPRCALHHC